MKHMQWLAMAAALGLAACSGEAPSEEAKPEPAAPGAGLYEASWTVEALNSTDRTTPATNLEVGTTGTTSGCVGDKSELDLLLFAEDGDECQATNSYMRGGRLNLQLECQRKGQGRVMQTVSGTTTAEGFEAEVSSSTYLSGPGDYSMTRKFSAKRVGECPAEGLGDGNLVAPAAGNEGAAQ